MGDDFEMQEQSTRAEVALMVAGLSGWRLTVVLLVVSVLCRTRF